MNRLCRRPSRPGYTLLEAVVALAVLASVAVVVIQLGTQSLAERARAEERFAAIEAAHNLLEAARASAWADLTPEWAAARRLPDDLAARLDAAQLVVQVEPEKDRPRVKRVSVELGWTHRTGAKARTVTLTALFADRAAGGQP